MANIHTDWGCGIETDYNPGFWWCVEIFKDDKVKICLQETLGVPVPHSHSILEIFTIDDEFDVYLPYEPHQRPKGKLEFSMKVGPRVEGDIEKRSQFEFEEYQKARAFSRGRDCFMVPEKGSQRYYPIRFPIRHE